MAITNLRIEDDLLKRIKVSAKKNNRSMNGEILQAIKVYLEMQEKPVKEIKEKT
jgi:predicted transcriptional regulator